MTTNMKKIRDGTMKKKIYLLISMIIIFICIFSTLPLAGAEGGTMELISPAFDEGGMIPGRYTCDGADVSPPLKWNALPRGTKSLAIICDDPDAPVGNWVHWVYYDIPAGTEGLSEKVATDDRPAEGGTQGLNDFRKIGYGGPCPPGGTHRYYFKLYALDTTLDLSSGATKKQVLKAMENHIIGQTQLMGKYRR
jgi:Raf kinase inhibitor-like YbhB/YbcL family protein